MRIIETEVCAYSLESVGIAADCGATRVELCASAAEGGTTPSAAAIRMAREYRNIELSVMIRPRGGDFLYSDTEFGEMKQDIEFARECGADCVVFGLLTAEGEIDISRTSELVRLAHPMEVTFHRAFDVSKNWSRSLEDIITAGCTRILTSGCRNSAPQGIEIIREMAKQSAGRIEIMAGGGVNPSNARMLATAGVDALHFSAKATRDSGMEYRSTYVRFSAGGLSDYEISYADPSFVREMVKKAEILSTTT